MSAARERGARGTSTGPRTVGVLPALGSGLTDLARGGQHERLLAYDLHHYCEAFERVVYFSYFDERLEDFTRDPLLLERVELIPKRGRWPNKLYALLLPLLHRRHVRRCEVFRVLQFPGVVPALVARALYGIPFAVTYGYHYGALARLAGSRLKPRLYRGLERLAFPRAAAVIVTSPEMEQLLTAHPLHPRLACFPNGVDTAQFAPADEVAEHQASSRGGNALARTPSRAGDAIAGISSRADAAAAGTPGRAGAAERPAGARRRVVYVGRLEPEKNLARLIDALARLRDVPVELVLIGDGRLRADLERRAQEAGVPLEAPGVVPHGELPRYLTGAECFALPSLTEGHPKALIEAMACGIPCVASARGGIPTVVEDGVTGLLVDPEDPEAIARAIRRALTDPALAHRLGRQARAEAMARYDARAILSAEAAFVRALGRGDGPLTDLFDDYARDVPMDGAPSEFVVERLSALSGESPRAVLDLGAGDGRYLEFLRTLFPRPAALVGGEISLRRARRIRGLGFPAVVLEAEALPFKTGAFDLVTLIEVIEHTRSPARTLDEARRVLRPGGRLVLTTPNYPMKRLFDLRAAVRQRSLARLRDDPTHVSPLTAGRLERLLRPRFDLVRFEGTAIPGQGHLAWLGTLRHSRAGRRLANKLFALGVRP